MLRVTCVLLHGRAINRASYRYLYHARGAASRIQHLTTLTVTPYPQRQHDNQFFWLDLLPLDLTDAKRDHRNPVVQGRIGCCIPSVPTAQRLNLINPQPRVLCDTQRHLAPVRSSTSHHLPVHQPRSISHVQEVSLVTLTPMPAHKSKSDGQSRGYRWLPSKSKSVNIVAATRACTHGVTGSLKSYPK